MVKYKMIVSDLDDTLLNDDLTISDKNLFFIKKYCSLGGIFIIATGRNPMSTLRYFDELCIDTYVICAQGTLIYYPKSSEVLFNKNINNNIAIQLMKYLESIEVYFQVFCKNTIYVHKKNHFSEQFIKRCGVEITEIGQKLSQHFTKNKEISINKIMIECSSDETEKVFENVNKKFSKQIDLNISKKWIIEATPLNATKKEALEKISKIYGISKKEILAIGDSYNDIKLFEAAGMRIAVGNAVEALKNIADYSVADNNSSGVAEAIEKFALK